MWTVHHTSSIKYFEALSYNVVVVVYNYDCLMFPPLVFFSQPSVRLTPGTLLYAGKSPDGNHILVSATS